tara:strand:- start:137 stop:514 length:378 start_codon:yes stop_codon:yes gene_type:complete
VIQSRQSSAAWITLEACKDLSPPRKVNAFAYQKRENFMPASRLQQQLEDLRDQLAQDPPLSEEERASLYILTQEIELQLALQAAAAPDATLIDGVNLAVERFEVSHPTLAGTLRNIVQSLANMGI